MSDERDITFCSNRQTDKKNVLTVQSVWMMTWQGRMTCGRAIRYMAGLCDTWQVLVGSWTTNRFLTRGIGGEWIGDTWPKQEPPRVTLAMV
jgi:hypothetical protein